MQYVIVTKTRGAFSDDVVIGSQEVPAMGERNIFDSLQEAGQVLNELVRDWANIEEIDEKEARKEFRICALVEV